MLVGQSATNELQKRNCSKNLLDLVTVVMTEIQTMNEVKYPTKIVVRVVLTSQITAAYVASGLM